jgi:molecular chaperone DnaK
MLKFLIGIFEHLVDKRASMNDQIKAKQLINNGKRLVTVESWEDIRIVNAQLWELMPTQDQKSDKIRSYIGII